MKLPVQRLLSLSGAPLQVQKGRPYPACNWQRGGDAQRSCYFFTFGISNKHHPERSILAEGTSAACWRSGGMLCRPSPGRGASSSRGIVLQSQSPAEIHLGELGPLERALQGQNSTSRSWVCSSELAHPLLLLETPSCSLSPRGGACSGAGAAAPALPETPEPPSAHPCSSGKLQRWKGQHKGLCWVRAS